MDTLLGLCVGIGLAAACGFRVFVPLMVLAIGARAGAVHLSDQMAFLASTPSLIALGTASVLETGAYWVPWIDHALDVVATPAAVVAGTLATASQLGDMGPLLTWGGALVAGGGAAAASQTLNVSARGVSTVTTAGVFNPIVSAVQSACSAILAVLAVLIPVAAAVLVVGTGVLVLWWWRRRSQRFVAVPA
ncbi:MAG: DUF4126 domain-containing protein [Planctomycetes bacterium]|nr:DUF4126 domain-containing protein [Planctomycetota bacterium]